MLTINFQYLQQLHFLDDKITANAIEFAGFKFGFFGFYDDGSTKSTNGHKLLLRNLGTRTDDVKFISKYVDSFTFKQENKKFRCDIYAMCGSFFGCTSIWTMCLIAFDR